MFKLALGIGAGLLLHCCSMNVVHAMGTDNHVLQAAPVPGPVKIDGDLSDWDQTARIPICSDVEKGWGSYSAWLSMMYDAEALYVGVDWCDPTPMVNNYEPSLDIDRRKCFHSDSLQIHFKTDIERKLIGWWYAKSNANGLISLNGWMPWEKHPILYLDAEKELGVTQAFKAKADGSGYFQEIRIPWTAISKNGHAYQSGEKFECMLDAVWGPDSGKGWPVNHMMDLVKPGAVHTGWFWEVSPIYGSVELATKDQLKKVEPEWIQARPQVSKIDGTISLRANIPEGALTHFDLAITDANNKRIRTLPGDCRITDYLVPGTEHTVEVKWDGLDDFGKLVAPGDYKISGLARGELKTIYDLCFYNPGTPPWSTADGTGGWGADHSPPTCVAAAGDDVVIGWGGSEGGCGIIGVGPDGLKKWGEHQGALALAADLDYAYFMLNDFWAGKSGLARINRKTGMYKPFDVDGKPELPVPAEKILDAKQTGPVNAIAAREGKLYLAFEWGDLATIDANTTKLINHVKVTKPLALAFAPDGQLWGVLDEKLNRIDPKSGECKVLECPELQKARTLTVDASGNLIVFDNGPDQQLKFFDTTGKLLKTIGKKSGRAVRGVFDPDTLNKVIALTVDAKGQIWTVEHSEHPRRVTVWNADGKIVRDYVGNTAYSACGTYLHDQNPNFGYAGSVEFKFDRATRRGNISQVFYVPDTAKGEQYSIGSTLTMPQRLTSSVSGKPHEYAFIHSWTSEHPYVIFLERANGWLPAAAIGYVWQIYGDSKKGPEGDFAGLSKSDGFFWNDANADGLIQRAECVIVPAIKEKSGKNLRSPFSITNGWGGKIGEDLTFYTDGIVGFKPIGFAEDGAPKYGPEGMLQTNANDRGDLVPLPAEDKLLVLSSTGYGATSYLRALDTRTWQELWRYPAYDHGVHGSHHATMPQPGHILGALKLCGAAHINDQVGTVMAIRGNLGEDFLVSSDGFYVGTLFRDSRLPGPSLPAKEEDLIGKNMMNLTEGGEPFNGWFGKQADGKVRISTGIPGQAALVAEVRGLESLRRFKGEDLKVDDTQLVAAETDNAKRAAAAQQIKTLAIKPVSASIKVDGELGEWSKIPAQAIERTGFPERGSFRLAYDAEKLYACFSVEDQSPWKNEGKDFARLFKTGDCADLQFSTEPNAAAKDVNASHVRLLFSQLNGKPVCVLMKPVDAAASPDVAYVYKSPVWEKKFARVQVLESAEVAVRVQKDRYTLEVAVPWSVLNLKPAAGIKIRGDAGFISSDENGTLNMARTYWSNKATNLTNDMPSEAWLQPGSWGEWTFE